MSDPRGPGFESIPGCAYNGCMGCNECRPLATAREIRARRAVATMAGDRQLELIAAITNNADLVAELVVAVGNMLAETDESCDPERLVAVAKAYASVKAVL